MSASTSSVKATKKSAFSCDPCRKRKVKCQGEQPSCSRCLARGDTCVYKLSPTLTYTQTLENKVRELERRLSAQQRTSTDSVIAAPGETTVAKPPAFEGLKLDSRGSITYHGATSFFQLPTSPALPPNSIENSIVPNLDQRDSRRDRLVSNAWQQRALENLSETPEPFKFLLDVHWCWIQPLFNFVYRPAFTRDMESLGPYYTHTLLNAMLSHSVRWCRNAPEIRDLLIPYDDGSLFSRQARTLLFEDLKEGHSTIPTIQTLLLLSAQECSAGNRTQAWLYSGMAFRLIEDMGISIDGQKYASTVKLSDEDIEIRHRLFWSCYFWDKIISLYLGRRPTIQYSVVNPPQIMLDDSAETELWAPHGIPHAQAAGYVPTPAHSISCFMRMCRLSEIFNQVLIHVYDPIGQNSETEINACLVSEGAALRKWWDELPDFLRIDTKAPPAQCPPSHIVTLNCLYFTFKILLYRPMLFRQKRPNPHHLIECISSATAIIGIFSLFTRTYGEAYCILSVSYSVYTAASIFLLQVQAATFRDDQALKRLRFCVQALDRVKSYNPVIVNSLALITESLAKLNIDLSTQDNDSEKSHTHNMEESNQTSFDLTIPEKPSRDTGGGFQQPSADYFDPDGFQVSTETLDALSSLEPIYATVGGLYNFQ